MGVVGAVYLLVALEFVLSHFFLLSFIIDA